MEKINSVLDRIAAPLNNIADWLLRLGLGIAFFYMDMENYLFLKVLWAG